MTHRLLLILATLAAYAPAQVPGSSALLGNPDPSNAYVDRHLHPAGKTGVVLVYWRATCKDHSFGCELSKDFESGSDAMFWAKVHLRTDEDGSALWLHEGSEYFTVSWVWGAVVRKNQYGVGIQEKLYSYGKYSLWKLGPSILPQLLVTYGDGQ